MCFLPRATLAPILSASTLGIIVVLAIGCLDWVCWRPNDLNKIGCWSGSICYFPISMASNDCWFLAENAHASADVCCGVQSQILAELSSSAALICIVIPTKDCGSALAPTHDGDLWLNEIRCNGLPLSQPIWIKIFMSCSLVCRTERLPLLRSCAQRHVSRCSLTPFVISASKLHRSASPWDHDEEDWTNAANALQLLCKSIKRRNMMWKSCSKHESTFCLAMLATSLFAMNSSGLTDKKFKAFSKRFLAQQFVW